MANHSNSSFDKLNDENYSTWSQKMEASLVKDGLWIYVEPRPESDQEEDLRVYMDGSKRAYASIILMMEDEIASTIADIKTAREAWIYLKQNYQQVSTSIKIRFFKRLFKMQLPIGGDMRTHINTLLTTVKQIKDRGIPIEDSIIVFTILSSLNEEYENIVTAMEAWSESQLTIGAVKSKLFEEYDRKKETSSCYSQSQLALQAKSMKPKYGEDCFFCGDYGHFKRDCPIRIAVMAAKEEENRKNMKQDNHVDVKQPLSANLCIHEWHRKLAHRNLQDIQVMKVQEGMCIDKCHCSNICEPCLQGKMSRTPFNTSENVNELLDVVVTDVCGPLSVKGLKNERYFITFTDLYSKYCTVFFMKTKDEAKQYVKFFVEGLKTSMNKKPKIIRSDRGGEYVNHDLQLYLASEGIKFQCTVAYTPQQNGVSERKNRTLMEAARTLLVDSEMPLCFWSEAVRHSNYVFNRVSTTRQKQSPYERFYGQKPTLENIYPFGTHVYSKIPDERRVKISLKSEKLRYVGVDENSKGFRLANVTKRLIIISRDVKIMNESAVTKTTKTTNFDLDDMLLLENLESNENRMNENKTIENETNENKTNDSEEVDFNENSEDKQHENEESNIIQGDDGIPTDQLKN
uniref:CSON001681 protein n=1 Tax=Culicoides sonorensis TaxID=179676 RepID=A0A336MHQ7_CULSO